MVTDTARHIPYSPTNVLQAKEVDIGRGDREETVQMCGGHFGETGELQESGHMFGLTLKFDRKTHAKGSAD